ncbi:MAG: hypothetical protein JWM86_738 [Thermoleophilia bacterium]|nr:hypothetical protein [Thermoleophilia bacterium]
MTRPPQTIVRVLKPKPNRFDPLLAGGVLVLAAIAIWIMSPMATGATGPLTSDTRIEVEVPVSTSVTPGWQAGDTNVRLPNAWLPGQSRDITSDGWRMTTNWANGYEVKIRSTTDPALRGSNSVDGKGAKSSFLDYRASGCPCPWNDAGYEKGIFGYSVSVESNATAPLEADKWGTSRAREWRGFTRTPYPVYSTAGGAGQYTMALHLRAMIPSGGTQVEGSYRANFVLSAHPLA